MKISRSGTQLAARRRTNTTRPTGFTLIEIMLVIGIAASLILAAFWVYTKVRDAAVVRGEIADIRHIITHVSQVQSIDPGGSTAWVSQRNLLLYYWSPSAGHENFIPPHMIQRNPNGSPIMNANFLNRFGGSVQIRSSNGIGMCSSPPCTKLWMIYQTQGRMSPEQCVAFVEGLAPWSERIQTTPGGRIQTNGKLLDKATIISRCAEGQAGNIQFVIDP